MAELDGSGLGEVFPNWMTHVTPKNAGLQGLVGNSPEPERPSELSMQTPQQLLEQAKSTSLTPLLWGCQLQTPVSSTVKAECNGTLFPGTITWVAPLVWLEQSMPDSPVLASLRQSLPFPTLQQNQGTSTTPVSVTSAATWTTPLNLLEAGMNTSLEERASTKDNTAETDSLLWHCSRDQLNGLSRVELEGRLESTLVIMEALSHKMRDCQKFHRPVAHVGLADQREVATQTIFDPKEEEQLYHDLYVALRKRYQSLQRSHENERTLAQKLASITKEMKEWSSDSKKFQDIIDTAFLHLQEDRTAINQQQEQMKGLLSRCQSKVQKSCQDQEDMKTRLEKALQDKETAFLVLESFRKLAGAQIKNLKQSSESQQHLRALLEEAHDHQVDLSRGYSKYVEEGDHLATAMQEDWAQMRLDYETWIKMLTRCRATVKGMQEEVKAARHERAQHKEVCDKLEASTVELVEALGRVNQLTEANAYLRKELEALLLRAGAAEDEQERLQQEREILSQCLAEKEKSLEEMTGLSREKEQEWEKMQRDLREALDCREFMEQESQVVRYQLTETEEELKATLSTLRERSTHLEDLKDNYKKLQQEQEVVVKELASTKAELQSAEVSMAKFYKTLLEIRAVQAQFLEMADILKAALQGKVMDVPQRSRPCTPAWQTPHRLGAYTPAWQTPHRLGAYTPAWQTPHRLGASLVDSILQAAAEKDVETPTSLHSDSSAFTKATPAIPPTPAEVEESLADSLLELQEAAAQLHVLICQHQKAKQEEVQDLQAENLRLEHLLESQRLQLQAELDSHDVNIAKLSKALRVRIQNEKELQDALQKQDERLQLLMDQSGEVANLQEEVAQQKRALQKAETEALALWEELKGTKPSTVDYVQEKIWLQQEVLKLRELLLAKGNENAELVANYQSQVKSLEDRLRQTQQVLRQHRKAEVEVREVLSSLPADVTSTPEIRHFLEFFY